MNAASKKKAKRIIFFVGLILAVIWFFRKPLAKQISNKTGGLIDTTLHNVESVLVVAAGVLVVIMAVMLLPLLWKLLVITAAIVVTIAIIRAMRKKRGTLTDSRPQGQRTSSTVVTQPIVNGANVPVASNPQTVVM